MIRLEVLKYSNNSTVKRGYFGHLLFGLIRIINITLINVVSSALSMVTKQNHAEDAWV